jgi:hypothetical protein
MQHSVLHESSAISARKAIWPNAIYTSLAWQIPLPSLNFTNIMTGLQIIVFAIW